MNPENKAPGAEYANWKAPETGKTTQESTEAQAVKPENRLLRLKSKDFYGSIANLEEGDEHPQTADKYREMGKAVDDLLSGKEDYDYSKTAEAVSVVCHNMLGWENYLNGAEVRGVSRQDQVIAQARHREAKEIFMGAC